MRHTASHRPTAGRGRRLPAVAAIATAAGIALAGCSGDRGTEPQASPAPQRVSSSSSSSVTPTPAAVEETTETVESVAPRTSTPAPAAPSSSPSTQLPALVVDARGPCHRIGEVAQSMDGTLLFCLDDPGGAGPLWLPPPESGPGASGPALLDQPCTQEGLVVTAPDGTALTCDLTGGGTTPGGLFWTQ